ncbi:MAG: hypothetical protein R3F11_17280 [Verrucomicrobiales bacterium]
MDLTFGDYLRALITADMDTVPDDDRNYRVAFIQAFRSRGIYPDDVRTLSPGSHSGGNRPATSAAWRPSAKSCGKSFLSRDSANCGIPSSRKAS